MSRIPDMVDRQMQHRQDGVQKYTSVVASQLANIDMVCRNLARVIFLIRYIEDYTNKMKR